MTINISVANRKGGVGKSTVATMLAHGFSCWGQKKTLLVDLDTQCNSSLMLVGGERWRDARYDERTIADYFYDRSLRAGADASDYLIAQAGDVVRADNTSPDLSLFCGSLDVEDILDEQLLNMAKGMKRLDMGVIRTRVSNYLGDFLSVIARPFDVVIFDCPPGLSLAVDAAQKRSQQVIVPFRPDYVSQYAIDRISQTIEGKHNLNGVVEIPAEKRRYRCVANFYRPGGPDEILIPEIALAHPILSARVQQRQSIQDSLDWQEERLSMDEKYGEGIGDVLKLYNECADLVGLA